MVGEQADPGDCRCRRTARSGSSDDRARWIATAPPDDRGPEKQPLRGSFRAHSTAAAIKWHRAVMELGGGSKNRGYFLQSDR